MATLQIGSHVRIADDAEPIEFRGKCGTVYAHLPSRVMGEWHAQIDGVPGDLGRCSFHESELILLTSLEAALNNEDEAVAIATNAAGVTVEVEYCANDPFGGRPFWIWQEANLEHPTPDDIHLSFGFKDMANELFARYDLDANAAIWTRKQEVNEERELNFDELAHQLTYVDPDSYRAGPFQGEAD